MRNCSYLVIRSDPQTGYPVSRVPGLYILCIHIFCGLHIWYRCLYGPQIKEILVLILYLRVSCCGKWGVGFEENDFPTEYVIIGTCLLNLLNKFICGSPLQSILYNKLPKPQIYMAFYSHTTS